MRLEPVPTNCAWICVRVHVCLRTRNVWRPQENLGLVSNPLVTIKLQNLYVSPGPDEGGNTSHFLMKNPDRSETVKQVDRDTPCASAFNWNAVPMKQLRRFEAKQKEFCQPCGFRCNNNGWLAIYPYHFKRDTTTTFFSHFRLSQASGISEFILPSRILFLSASVNFQYKLIYRISVKYISVKVKYTENYIFKAKFLRFNRRSREHVPQSLCF